MNPRTSLTHPLEIASIAPDANFGLVGLSLCPGKIQHAAATGRWSRDLAVDLDAVQAWGASVVVTLVEASELARLGVTQMGPEVQKRHMAWYHLPIRDVSTPGAEFEAAWVTAGAELRARLRAGFNVFVHCMGGLGRAGTIAARLLVELGWPPAEAIGKLREVRPGALETRGQVEFVMALKPAAERAPSRSPAAVREGAPNIRLAYPPQPNNQELPPVKARRWGMETPHTGLGHQILEAGWHARMSSRQR